MATTQPDALTQMMWLGLSAEWMPAACPYQQAAPVVFSASTASFLRAQQRGRPVKASHLYMAPAPSPVTSQGPAPGPGCSDNGRARRASVHLISGLLMTQGREDCEVNHHVSYLSAFFPSDACSMRGKILDNCYQSESKHFKISAEPEILALCFGSTIRSDV